MASIFNSGWRFTTIPALCERAAAVYGRDTAIEDGETRLTFIDLDAARRRAARAMIAAGLNPGDRAMIWAPNSWKWFVTALAIVSVGGVLAPTSTRFKGAEVEELMRRSGASLMFCCGEFLGDYYPDRLAPSARALLREIVVFDGARRETAWDDFLSRGDCIPEATLSSRQAAVQQDDLCDMLFTSGTTGYPKGVMYAHRQCLMVVDAWAERVGLRRGDRVLVVPPFFHAFGYRSGAIVSMMRGAVLIPHLTYDAGEILNRIERERVSVVPGPPAIFHGMLQHPGMDGFDRSSLRLGVTGGAVVPATLIRRMREDLGFTTVVSGYGLTECGGYGTLCSAGDSDEQVANTAGKPFPDTEVRIMSDGGRLLPDGERGEVVLRGYFVMKGYFCDADSTARTIDPDGWLHSGDIGYFDGNGDLRIEDRLKDMYITGGFNCYPAEIERMMSAHPAVGQIAVIGVPDERLGEVGKAFVVLRPGESATELELCEWARAHMANFKAPRSVVFRDALPTSPQGKVLKTKLREEEKAAS